MWTNELDIQYTVTFTDLIAWTIPVYISGNELGGTYTSVVYASTQFSTSPSSVTVNWENFNNTCILVSITMTLVGTQPPAETWGLQFRDYPPNFGPYVFTPSLVNYNQYNVITDGTYFPETDYVTEGNNDGVEGFNVFISNVFGVGTGYMNWNGSYTWVFSLEGTFV